MIALKIVLTEINLLKIEKKESKKNNFFKVNADKKKSLNIKSLWFSWTIEEILNSFFDSSHCIYWYKKYNLIIK